MGDRHKVPGAHAESQQMSTGRTRVRGVTTKQRRELAKRDGLTDGILRSAQDDRYFVILSPQGEESRP